jgi:hypothetical protein
MRIHNLYTDASGQSHFRDIEVEWVEERRGSKFSKRMPATGIKLGEVFAPDDVHRVVVWVRPIHRRGGWQDALWVHCEVVGDVSDGEGAEDIFRFGAALPASNEGLSGAAWRFSPHGVVARGGASDVEATV